MGTDRGRSTADAAPELAISDDAARAPWRRHAWIRALERLRPARAIAAPGASDVSVAATEAPAHASEQSRLGGRIFHAVWMVLGIAACAFSIWASARGLNKSIDAYDEGVVLTGANEILWGKIPYRDFYSNYPPGVFLLLAACFKVVGASVGVERVLGIALHATVGLGAGRVGARLLGGRFSWLVAGVVLSWLKLLGTHTFAWLAALTLALLACDLWPWVQARARPGAYLALGALLGTISWFRHDLFVYLSLTLGAAGAAWAVLELRRGDRTRLAMLLWIGGGALAAVSLMWMPVFALAGFGRVSADLYFDQVHHTMPARVLPMPSLFTLAPDRFLGLSLPAFLHVRFPLAVFVTLAGPVLALAAVLWPRSAGLRQRSLLVWLAALTIAVLPQMLGRTDVYHAAFSLTPALIACCLWLHGGPMRPFRALWAWPLTLVGLTLLAAPTLGWPGPRAEPAAGGMPRASRTPVDVVRRRSVRFIAQHTQPGDPIYVGLTDHRFIHKNDMDLYFLSDRVGATRYMQFDPNMINREEVQQEMIADLERVRPKVALLVKRNRSREPNESRNGGSSLLDRYLAQHYVASGHSGNVTFTLRKPEDGDAQP